MNKKSFNAVKLLIVILFLFALNTSLVKAQCNHDVVLSPPALTQTGGTFSIPITFTDDSSAECVGSTTYSITTSSSGCSGVSLSTNGFTLSTGQSTSATLSGSVSANYNSCSVVIRVIQVGPAYLVGGGSYITNAVCDSNHCTACSGSNCPDNCLQCSLDSKCYPSSTTSCYCTAATESDNGLNYNTKGSCTSITDFCIKHTYNDFCPWDGGRGYCCSTLGSNWNPSSFSDDGTTVCCQKNDLLSTSCLQTKTINCKNIIGEYSASGKNCKLNIYDCSSSGGTCSNGACVSGSSCTPTTCSALGKQCGSWSNGCSGTLNCGTCSQGQACDSNGVCVSGSTCSGTTALSCTVPGFEHSNDERFWGDASCGRTSATTGCNSNGHNICDSNSNACNLIEPTINSYSVSKTSVGVGESFSLSVNGNCPAGLPGKCLVECRVIHPDGHYIELDTWDKIGIVTPPSIKCNQVGNYIVSYCGIFTDYFANGGWGSFNNVQTTIDCSSGSTGSQITLQPGWNMFSIPVSTPVNADDIRTKCGTTSRIWHYDSSSGSYVDVASLTPGLGYWIKLSSACTVDNLQGNSFDVSGIPSLNIGWNQVGSPSSSVGFNSIKANCAVLSGPWKYDTSTGSYQSSDTLNPGYGYWVRVSNSCTLG